MRKLVLLFVLLLTSVHIYPQNAIKILGNLRRLSKVAVERTIYVPKVDYLPAVAIASHYEPYKVVNYGSIAQIEYNITFQINSLKLPDTIYGPYNYMRAISKVSKQTKFIHPDYMSIWSKLNNSVGYNGVHHLINKSTIKQICSDYACSSAILTEMQKNAPSIFHPFHGNPHFTTIFHNSEEQYENYVRFGMKRTAEIQLDKINELNKAMGKPKLTEEYIEGILNEVKIWCSIYGLTY